jgi:putative Holliday junction resolvase
MSTANTRLLGVDYGMRRVGLAVCDSERRIAVPLVIYERRRGVTDAAFFRDLVQREAIGGLVVGLPVHMSGDEGQRAGEARAFGAWLSKTTQLPVWYWDERLTTSQAHQVMRAAGVKLNQRKSKVDMVAAQMLLQSFLDAGCPENPTPPGPLQGMESKSIQPENAAATGAEATLEE